MSDCKLILKNFKSYKEECCITWKYFTTIIGKNGEGKSTIIDALKFLCCFPQYKNKSVKRLKQELTNYNSPLDIYPSTWVKFIFYINDNAQMKEYTFHRIIHYNTSIQEFIINDQIVDIKTYKQYLLKFNIIYKANYFFITQNTIENMVLQNPKDRALFLEEICGSQSYIKEYTSLNKKLMELSNIAAKLKQNLNYYSSKLRKCNKMIKKFKEYSMKREKLSQTETEYYFAKLYQIEKLKDEHIKSKEADAASILDLQNKKIELENQLQELKDELAKEENMLEKQFTNKVDQLFDLQLNEKISYYSKMIEDLERNLNKAKAMHASHLKHIDNLKKEYNEVEVQKNNYIASQSQDCSLEMEDKQYKLYLNLKSKALKIISKEIGLLDSNKREQDLIKDKIEININEQEALNKEIENIKLHLNHLVNCIQQNDQEIKNLEMKMNEKEQTIKQTEFKLNDLNKKTNCLCEEINEANVRLTEYKGSKDEIRKFHKKQEVLTNLKLHFTGIHDRLGNLCQPSHEKYQIPFTKIIGPKINNIVVDNNLTALKCIRFLKEQYAGTNYSTIETFLPLDTYICLKSPSNKITKLLADNPKVKFALNTIYAKHNLEPLIYQAIGDVLIYESNDDSEVADFAYLHKINVVSLNGTYYKKNGSFSGGLSDLKCESKLWKSQEREDLIINLESKKQELQEIRKYMLSEKENLETLKNETFGLFKRRDAYLKPSILLKEIEKKDLLKKLIELNLKLKSLKEDSTIKNYHKILKEKEEEAKILEHRISAAEDMVFSKFCEKYHIKNIRQYKEYSFMQQQERTDRINAFDNLLDEINNQIKYEESRDTQAPVKKLEDKLKKLKEQTYSKLMLQKERLVEQTNSSSEQVTENLRQTIKDKQKNIKVIEAHIKALKEKLKNVQSNIKHTDIQILNLKVKKHTLIKDCKLNNINIPLEIGSIEDVAIESKIYETTTTDSIDNNLEESSNFRFPEKQVKLDYQKWQDYMSSLEKANLKKHIDDLKITRENIKKELDEMNVIKKSQEDYDYINEEIHKLKIDYESAVSEANNAKNQFEQIKNKRLKVFSNFLDSVTAELDVHIKSLFRDNSAEAYLIIRNTDEPFLDGIDFGCIIPKKQYVLINQLSGAEQCITAIALIFSIYSVKPCPFLIFDEIDASLDNVNLDKIDNFFYDLNINPPIDICWISHRKILKKISNRINGIFMDPFDQSSKSIHINISDCTIEATPENCIKYNQILHIEHAIDMYKRSTDNVIKRVVISDE